MLCIRSPGNRDLLGRVVIIRVMVIGHPLGQKLHSIHLGVSEWSRLNCVVNAFPIFRDLEEGWYVVRGSWHAPHQKNHVRP